MTIDDALARFLVQLEADGRSPHTIVTVRSFQVGADHKKRLTAATDHVLFCFWSTARAPLRWLQERGPFLPAGSTSRPGRAGDTRLPSGEEETRELSLQHTVFPSTPQKSSPSFQLSNSRCRDLLLVIVRSKSCDQDRLIPVRLLDRICAAKRISLRKRERAQ